MIAIGLNSPLAPIEDPEAPSSINAYDYFLGPVAEIKRPVEEVYEEIKATTKVEDNFEALVRATWRLETGNGTSYLWLNQFNAGGIKCGTSFCAYSNKQEGMDHLTRLLKSYVEKFSYDLGAIRSVYSESDDTALFTQIYNEEKNR